MIINLSADWRIKTTEPPQYVVEKFTPGTKGGQRTWVPKAYCNTLDHAVIWIGRRRILELPGEYNREALTPLCEALDVIVKDVRTALKTIEVDALR